ncbi:MAG: hypothetical protein CMH49_07815 [Myxococcales bacterium]|nr:hypothetical protein [Myxococcales bacterium]
MACTPPCRFDEEQNCIVDEMEEDLGGTGGEIDIELGGAEGDIDIDIDGNGGNGNGNGGGITVDIMPSDDLSPKVVDLLVMAPFDQSVIGAYYGVIMDTVITQLDRYKISVAHAAIAPMYRRLNTDTPLLYGTPDNESEFMNYNEAFEYFSSEEGLLPLDNEVDIDGENLLQLGASLGTAGVYHPRQGSEGSQYLFRAPQDGMLVLWINPFARRCNLNDCEGAEGNLAAKLIASNGQEEATWLSLGGQGRLPLQNIVHAFVGTEETSDEDGFFERCENRVGLPSRILDHIEPSPINLYQQLNRHLTEEGLGSYRVDFCQAVSDEGYDALEGVAQKLRQKID